MLIRLARSRWAVALMALTLFAGSCGSDSEETPDAKSEAPVEAPVAATTVKIGYTPILSGGVAFAGVPLADGAELAVMEANESNFLGAGVTIELVGEDTGGDQATTIGNLDKLIADEDVLGVVCCALSSVSGSLLPVAEEAEIAMIGWGAIAPNLSESPVFWRSFPNGSLSTPLITDDAIAAFGPSTAVVTRTADNDGMIADSAIYVERLEAAGVELLAVVDTFADDTDMSGPATQVIAENPDIVFTGQLGNTEVLMIAELRDRGYDGPIVGNLALAPQSIFEQAGDTLLGTVFPLAYFPGNPASASQHFTELWNANQDVEPDIFAAQGYMAVWMLLNGIKAADSYDRAAVLAGVESLTGANTPEGQLEYIDHEAPTDSFVYVQWSSDGTQTVWDGTSAGLLANVNK